eukprot:Hpha_TRINITY_DN15315_c5_g3::TRINITY_DN15315_c5_g3_i2::g.91378::m.91378
MRAASMSGWNNTHSTRTSSTTHNTTKHFDAVQQIHDGIAEAIQLLDMGIAGEPLPTSGSGGSSGQRFASAQKGGRTSPPGRVGLRESATQHSRAPRNRFAAPPSGPNRPRQQQARRPRAASFEGGRCHPSTGVVRRSASPPAARPSHRMSETGWRHSSADPVRRGYRSSEGRTSPTKRVGGRTQSPPHPSRPRLRHSVTSSHRTPTTPETPPVHSRDTPPAPPEYPPTATARGSSPPQQYEREAFEMPPQVILPPSAVRGRLPSGGPATAASRRGKLSSGPSGRSSLLPPPPQPLAAGGGKMGGRGKGALSMRGGAHPPTTVQHSAPSPSSSLDTMNTVTEDSVEEGMTLWVSTDAARVAHLLRQSVSGAAPQQDAYVGLQGVVVRFDDCDRDWKQVRLEHQDGQEFVWPLAALRVPTGDQPPPPPPPPSRGSHFTQPQQLMQQQLPMHQSSSVMPMALPPAAMAGRRPVPGPIYRNKVIPGKPAVHPAPPISIPPPIPPPQNAVAPAVAPAAAATQPPASAPAAARPAAGAPAPAAPAPAAADTSAKVGKSPPRDAGAAPEKAAPPMPSPPAEPKQRAEADKDSAPEAQKLPSPPASPPVLVNASPAVMAKIAPPSPPRHAGADAEDLEGDEEEKAIMAMEAGLCDGGVPQVAQMPFNMGKHGRLQAAASKDIPPLDQATPRDYCACASFIAALALAACVARDDSLPTLPRLLPPRPEVCLMCQARWCLVTMKQRKGARLRSYRFECSRCGAQHLQSKGSGHVRLARPDYLATPNAVRHAAKAGNPLQETEVEAAVNAARAAALRAARHAERAQATVLDSARREKSGLGGKMVPPPAGLSDGVQRSSVSDGSSPPPQCGLPSPKPTSDDDDGDESIAETTSDSSPRPPEPEEKVVRAEPQPVPTEPTQLLYVGEPVQPLQPLQPLPERPLSDDGEQITVC